MGAVDLADLTSDRSSCEQHMGIFDLLCNRVMYDRGRVFPCFWEEIRQLGAPRCIIFDPDADC